MSINTLIQHLPSSFDICHLARHKPRVMTRKKAKPAFQKGYNIHGMKYTVFDQDNTKDGSYHVSQNDKNLHHTVA